MPKIQSNTIQVFEHQTIRVGDQINNVQFDESVFKALAKYHEKQKVKYFSLVYNGIKFSHYVGIIQIGKLTIEILPKADTNAVDNPAKWQAVLLEMLQYCRLLKVESLGIGKVRLKSNTILDLYFGQFLSAVNALLIKGLPKQYLPKESNQKALKGRLVLPKHLRKNGLHPERFYVRHTIFEFDHLFNRVLQEALKVLQQVNLKSSLQVQLNQVLSTFPNITPYTVKSRDFAQLFHSQKYQPYHELLEISRLIIFNFSPDIRSGQNHLFALLFDMNQLFEEYVFWKLKALENDQIKIQRQTSKPFWQRRTIRPDLVISLANHQYVLDTKWKVLSSPSPSMADLKQLYIYCQYFEAERGILLYPKVNAIENSKVIPFQSTKTETNKIHGQVLFLNILQENGQLNRDLGKDLLALLNN